MVCGEPPRGSRNRKKVCIPTFKGISLSPLASKLQMVPTLSPLVAEKDDL